ncbi:FKBP-type peptidylprolyl isomerase [Flavobacterium sp. GSP27]|uniref:FKBP-type peptidyl-prolyl cis-trans isomerase n=1 Tax=unclassified Flavobacterium TaxID=196869 RepID=UPI000F830AE3|nr:MULTISPECIES: FKBP-type peptidylprolyl isomerase [unclassified Flavobacterium]RTZ04666.1 FKBP-type peptidylprolyl isomerase [Flavobacterium sp. GSP27]RTZ07481.1 FKBP-type peptidylprolyl isomerase [Flavobacterium sp. GSP6]
MNKFKYYFILLITTISLFSCSKDEAAEIQPPRDFAVQYATDLTDIEEYLKNYYITVVNHAGFPDDQDVSYTKIPAGGSQPSIWSYKDKTTFPKLLSRDVKLHDITYTLYYLVLREGAGKSPTNADAVLASYKGDYLSRTTVSEVTTLSATQFEVVKNPQQFFSLLTTVVGWGETFPQFKTGTYDSNTDGTVSYRDFGAGVMFLPSGLGYYNSGSGSIPSYAPLVFSFKLYEINRLDSDGDGIMNFQEDLDGDGYMRVLATGVINPDDTDGDGIPNFLDTDDDGDSVSTRTEITDANGVLIPFESIPSCSGNTTDPARIKRHLVKCN